MLIPLAAAALLFPIAYMAVPPVVSAWRRRREARRAFTPRKRPVETICLPPADETAECVRRFHAAVRRSDLADYLGP